MIPLSNGRSPRIDQFYATLRTIKSYHFNEDSINRPYTEQDKSIQHIRSLGKEILEDFSSHKKTSLGNQTLRDMFRSSQTLIKHKNLYDKYKQKNDPKVYKEIVNLREVIIKQNKNKTPEKLPKDKKYQKVVSKLQQKPNSIGLNYIKKADIQIQKLKEHKKQSQKNKPQIRKWQQEYEKTTRKPNHQATATRVVKRGQELQAKKAKCIERIRTQRIQLQKILHTFKPEMTSRKLPIETNFKKRVQVAQQNKISKEKQLIKEAYETHSFNPQTNQYKQANSKIVNLWKQNTKRTNKNSISYIRTDSNQDEGEKQFNSQKTANSTTQINLKSVNQISFIFQ